MMGERRVRQDALFYEFSLERHVPERHLLRSIDRFVALDGLRQELGPFYSEMGRPSIDESFTNAREADARLCHRETVSLDKATKRQPERFQWPEADFAVDWARGS